MAIYVGKGMVNDRMRKKYLVVWAALLAVFLFAACGDAANEPEEPAVLPETDAAAAEQEKTELLKVYYSNAKADGLEEETTEVEAIVPDVIIERLAVHNIVSIDTKVNSFETDEEEGKTILYLDLSKAFSEYLRTMGSSGESMIMKALTRTFLEAYSADSIVLTVEGEALETAHAVYDQPLTVS